MVAVEGQDSRVLFTVSCPGKFSLCMVCIYIYIYIYIDTHTHINMKTAL